MAMIENSELVREVPLKDIRVSELNVRREDAEVGINELAESIKKYGLLQPVVLMGEYGKPPYDLIVGRRRLLAHERLGRTNIRALFHERADDWKLRMLSLSENMHRLDMNYADKAEAITLLFQHFDRNAKKLAREIGLSEQTIYDYVRIEEQATEKVKNLLKRHKINKVDARRVIQAAQGDPEKIDYLVDELPKMTRYEKDRAVDYGKKSKDASGETIARQARIPKFEKTVILNLDEATDSALEKAESKMAMGRERIVGLALDQWLRENGFLAEVIDKV